MSEQIQQLDEAGQQEREKIVAAMILRFGKAKTSEYLDDPKILRFMNALAHVISRKTTS